MVGTSQLINTFSRPCFTDTTDIFKDRSGVALYGLDYDASDAGGASGKFGEAAIFNGSSSIIQSPLDLDDYDETWSISMWVKFDFNSSYRGVAGTVNSSALNGFVIDIGTSGEIRFRFRNGSTSVSALSSSSTYGDGNWHHIVVVKGATTNYLYIDNNSEVLSVATTTGITHNAQITFGRTGSYTDYFKGSIDQVRIFNTALTQSQVTQLYQENNSTVGTHLFGCIANYNLDGSAKESMGTTAYDGTETDITYRYDGTPTNVDFGVGGKSNYGARFNGSSSYIETPSIIPANNFSFSCWINMNSLPASNANQIIYNTNVDRRWYVSIFDGGKIQAWNGVSSFTTTSNVVTTNQWYHIAYTADGTNGKKIYVNGVEVFTTSDTVSNNIPSTGNAWKGFGKWYTNALYLDGDLDQVRIFDKAISAAEVSKLYGNGAGEIACAYKSTTNIVNYPTGTTPVAYYKMDNSSEDETGSYDGTETNVEYRFGRYGQAAVFNNDSAITTSFNIGRTNDFTISFWIKDITDSNYGSYADKWVMGVYNNDYIPINYNKTSGKVSYIVHDGTTLLGTLQTPVLDDNWHHIVFTQDVNIETKLYVDGVLQTAETVSHTSMTQRRSVSPGTGFYFGQNPANSSTDLRLKGSIDQVRIYNTALTSDQVTELYNEKPEVDTSNFKTVLYEGNGGTQYISNVGFEPDLVWIKSRGAAGSHILTDSIRGDGKEIYSDLTNAEGTVNRIALDSNGFTVTSSSYPNQSGNTFVAWNWKGGGEAVNIAVNSITASTPSIASDVSANTNAGFSIVKYTGNGANATVGHGLSSAPELIITKGLTTAYNWNVSSSLIPNGYLQLNTTDGLTSVSTRYVASGATTNSLTNYVQFNQNNIEHIAYCFHSVAGYSKIGTYQGNSSTTGPLVSVGFEPSFIMVKGITSSYASHWMMIDSTRDTDTVKDKRVLANLSNAESDDANWAVEFNSDGFQPKSTFSGFNHSSGTYLYMAFK